MERVNASPQKIQLISHDLKTCPFAARVQALQTELAYYKAICLAYQTGRLKAQGSYRRLTIHKNIPKEQQQQQNSVLEHKQGFKEEQQKFSEHIDRKIKKGIQKKQQQFPIHESQINFSTKSRASLKYTKDEVNFMMHSTYQVPVQNLTEPSQQGYTTQIEPITHTQNNNNDCTALDDLVKNLPMITMINQQSKSDKLSQIEQPIEVQHSQQTKPSLPFISDLCVFGCSQKCLEQLPNEKVVQVDPSLLFSMFQFNSKPYYDQVAKYLFPNGLFTRRMRNQKLIGEVNQILLQNVKKHSNFIYQLQSELTLQDISKQQRQLIKRINPTLNLYCISVKFNDFTIVETDHVLSDKQKSPQTSAVREQKSIGNISNRSDSYPNKKNKDLKDINKCTVYSNKKVMSIFTFYPFFEFFESFLISIYNSLKVQKLGIYQNKLDTVFKVDSSFTINQLENIYSSLVSVINTTKIVTNLDYEFSLGIDLLKISTQSHKLSDAWLGYWLYPVLRLFDKNSFYDTLSAILFEDQVIFVCDNPHILSFIIYLFSQILVRPFHYQHSIIYFVSQWELLDAPTPIILGVNKPSDWLDTNTRPNHLYIQIGQQVTLIDKRQQHKRIKSEKLRKLCSTFFKRIDKDSISLFKDKKKKDGHEYNMSTSKEQKQICMHFLTSITIFLKQQLIDKFPNEHFVINVKQKFKVNNANNDLDPATVISQQIIKQMCKSRKQKDAFLEKLMKSQLFLTYLFDIVKIQQ